MTFNESIFSEGSSAHLDNRSAITSNLVTYEASPKRSLSKSLGTLLRTIAAASNG